MFGQTLLKGIAQKENTTTSQVFSAGFSKFMAEGGAEKTDINPLTMKENGMRSPNPMSYLALKTTGSGNGSQKSGSTTGKGETDDTDGQM